MSYQDQVVASMNNPQAAKAWKIADIWRDRFANLAARFVSKEIETDQKDFIRVIQFGINDAVHALELREQKTRAARASALAFFFAGLIAIEAFGLVLWNL